MKKIFTLLLFGYFSITLLVAQNSRKEWTEGKLTWEDFQEQETGPQISEFIYFLGYETTKQRSGDTTLLRVSATCYMDRNLSWIHPGFKTDQYLRYNQVIFDIVELHRRRLQYELDRVSTFFDIEDQFERIRNACKSEIEQFYTESQGGQNMDVIEFWEKNVAIGLGLIRVEEIPEFYDRNFGYALHAGFGAGVFTGTLGEHFNPSLNFIFGFDFAFKNSVWFLNGTLAGTKISKDYLSDKNWYTGERANVAIIEISYGYAFIDNAWLKFTPFAGLGITEFTGKNPDNEEDGLRMTDYNVLFGLNADYKIRTRVNLATSPYLAVKEKIETSIRFRFYVTRANYYTDLQGYTVNLSIGVCGFGNMIQLNE